MSINHTWSGSHGSGIIIPLQVLTFSPEYQQYLQLVVSSYFRSGNLNFALLKMSLWINTGYVADCFRLSCLANNYRNRLFVNVAKPLIRTIACLR